MGGKKAKPVPQTPEEKSLLRAQLLTLQKQDTEINERKRRILRGQYSSFAGALKTGGSTAGAGGGSGMGGRAGIQPLSGSMQ